MPTGTWIVEKGATAPGGGGTPPPLSPLPNAILGTPVLSTAFGTDENHQFLISVTIPVSWTGNNWGAVDRLVVHLHAPDTEVDTQEGFVGGPGTGDVTPDEEVPGLIIGDESNASKIVSIESAAVLIEKPWDPERPFLQFEYPAPTAEEWWRAVVISASKQQKNPESTSPAVRFHVTPQGADVAGVEYAPLALNFHLIDPRTGLVTDQPVYDTAEGGTPVWGFSCSWENDTKDPRWTILGGYDLVIEYPDGMRETHVSKSSNDVRHDSPMWTFGADGDFTVWCVSWSSQAGNKRNSIIPGLTPHVTFRVARQVGAHGQYADNVISPTLTNPYYGTNGAGQKALFLPFAWTEPDDRRFQGAIVRMKRADGNEYTLTGLETTPSVISELIQFPAAAEAVEFRFYSVATDGSTNPYVPGWPGDPDGTPTIALTLYPPPDSTPDVSVLQITVVYGKDEFGNNTYGYTGTWANPNKALFPEYQGIKLYQADASGNNRKPLSGIETGQSWASSMWPLTPASGIYIYAPSVDVNGREKDLTQAPRIGPLFILAQGGTITNAALPDLNVADFAAGVEPITFIDSAPNAAGDVAVPKQTTTVFNNNDKRLYRWNATSGKYHVVGSALDIDANTVTAGLVAAGAIRSYHMMSNEILVGPAPTGSLTDQRPPIFKVENINRAMVGFFGTYAGWEGIYALNLRIGPSFAQPTVEASATGLAIYGSAANPVTFQITGSNGDYVKMSQVTFDPTYSSIGILASSQTNANQCYHVSRGLIAYEGSTKYLALVRNPNYAAGELTLFPPGDGSNFRVYLSAVDANAGGVARGIVRADRFDCAGKPGYTSPGDTYQTGFTRIWVSGGLVIGVQ